MADIAEAGPNAADTAAAGLRLPGLADTAIVPFSGWAIPPFDPEQGIASYRE